jgi:N-methylhydantoinase B/oxoprolinase/acetone carboxylase alpha subunit
MKNIIKGVLSDIANDQINLASSAARETITNLIVAALKSRGCYTEYDEADEDEWLNSEKWECGICGENTFEVDFDYIGSGTNHLNCELEAEVA